ncbi:MAG: orotidine-5'-phosphate decarboxylase [Candidatus Thermoplasmatota archaeon]|nr:orotidine-5'-phosphate decarboxylase [Candidatus Thermoplasmatota archaeon]
MRWKEKLGRAVSEKGTVLCVGLDTDMTRFGPEGCGMDQFEINREIVSHTAGNAAAYKLNLAFYEAEGVRGQSALEKTVSYILREHPEILVILDGKRGDIGNTSKAYARAAFEHLGADAVTLNAYMGKDAVVPFSSDPDRLCFILCRTSNPSSAAVQDASCGGAPFYLRMADLIRSWNDKGNLGAVVGATYPEEMARIRSAVGEEMPFLVPGVGSQGGGIDDVVKNGTNRNGEGVLINVSRDIMFAFEKQGRPAKDMGPCASDSAERFAKVVRATMRGAGKW